MTCLDTFPQPGVEDRVLPADPFYSLRYHFGMLLGVEDFEAEQAYHRGKHRLHNAWLHRDGVVWGLEVSTPTTDTGLTRNEIEVSPGLALDAAGNELHVDTPMCVDIGKWYEDRKEKGDFSEDDEEPAGGRIVAQFDAHVVALFSACLLRPVPALMEPCAGSGNDTAYSRAFETVELLLLPGLPAPDPRPLPYHRLRLLFGLEPEHEEEGQVTDSDKDVLDARDKVAAAADADRPALMLEQFRWCAALDVIDLQGDDASTRGAARYPQDNRPPVLLGTAIGVRISRAGNDSVWTLDQVKIDNTVRRSLVATSTIQELLCGCSCAGAAAVTPAGAGSRPASARTRGATPATAAKIEDAHGPRIDPESVKLGKDRIEFRTNKALAAESVAESAIALYSFDRKKGWTPHPIGKLEYHDKEHRVVAHVSRPTGDALRLVVRGTGDAPLLGRDLVPLAGGIGGGPGTKHDGNDFTFMLHPRS